MFQIKSKTLKQTKPQNREAQMKMYKDEVKMSGGPLSLIRRANMLNIFLEVQS